MRQPIGRDDVVTTLVVILEQTPGGEVVSLTDSPQHYAGAASGALHVGETRIAECHLDLLYLLHSAAPYIHFDFAPTAHRRGRRARCLNPVHIVESSLR